MKVLFIITCSMFLAVATNAAQTCPADSIPASTPDSQLIDNNDGTITDLKTGLTWKKCLEGVFGDFCENGSPNVFTWQQALQHPGTVNDDEGFADYTDWRLPNIRELFSLVEIQCSDPAINRNRFPNTPSSDVWSGSPCVDFCGEGCFDYSAWKVNFNYGKSSNPSRNSTYAVRLVRGGR